VFPHRQQGIVALPVDVLRGFTHYPRHLYQSEKKRLFNRFRYADLPSWNRHWSAESEANPTATISHCDPFILVYVIYHS
jgi:hypothetical protein